MLTKQLVAHIKSCLPVLIERCSKELEQATKELSHISDPVPTDKQSYLMQVVLCQFCIIQRFDFRFINLKKLLMEYGEQLIAATTGDFGVETHFQDGPPLHELNSQCLQLFPKTRAAFRSLESKLEELKPSRQCTNKYKP